MDTEQVELPGTMTLEQQSKAIEGEEAQGKRFVGAGLWVNAQHKVSNRATFELLDEEPDLPLGRPVLKLALAAGETAAWTGQLIVKGSAKLAIEVGTSPDALTAAVAGLGYRATLADAPSVSTPGGLLDKMRDLLGGNDKTVTCLIVKQTL